MDTPVAGQIQVGDIGEKECSMSRKTGQTVVMEAQSLEARHVPQPLPGEGRQEVPIQTQLSQGLQVHKAAGVDGCNGVVGQPQEAQL